MTTNHCTKLQFRKAAYDYQYQVGLNSIETETGTWTEGKRVTKTGKGKEKERHREKESPVFVDAFVIVNKHDNVFQFHGSTYNGCYYLSS